MKVAYFGYDFFFGCFDSLSRSGHNIYKVFTFDCDNEKYNFNKRLSDAACKINAELICRKVTAEDIKQLMSDGCDLIISAGYPFKIPVLPKGMPYAINIHPTLLPEGKGPWPLPWVILKNIQKSGVTIHKLAEKIDSGDILIQNYYDVTESDDLETISCKAQMLAIELLSKLMLDFNFFWNTSKPQPGEGSYWGMPELSDRTINWSEDIFSIKRTARAFGKFDACAIFDDKEWIIQDVNVWKENHSHPYGTVVHRTNREFVIAAKDGYACLRFYDIDPDFKEGE